MGTLAEAQLFDMRWRKALNRLGWVLWAGSGQRSCEHTALGASWKAAGSGQKLSHVSFSLSALSFQNGSGQDRTCPFHITSLPSQIDCHLLFLCGSPSRQEQCVLMPLGQEWCFLKTDPGAAKTRAGTRPDDISS